MTPGDIGFARTTGFMGRLETATGLVPRLRRVVAYATHAITTRRSVGVCWCVLVALWAMSLPPVKAFGSRSEDATSHIFCVSHWFKMVRVNARRIATQVVEFEALRYSPLDKPVRDPVCQLVFAAPRNCPVAALVTASRPNPTRIGLIDLHPKSRNRIASGCIHESHLGIAAPPPVHIVRIAPTSTVMRASTAFYRTNPLPHKIHSTHVVIP